MVRTRIRSVLLGLLGIIVAVIFIRILLDFFGANQSTGFVSFFNNLSEFFIAPFDNLIDVNNQNASNINFDALAAFFIYLVLGLLVIELICAFIYDNIEDIIQNIIDAAFKIVEFFLLVRIILDFFLIDQQINFIKTVYSLTNWASDIIFEKGFIDPRVNFSAIVVLVIIVIVDLFTESLLNALFKKVDYKKVQQSKPLAQNITINVPAQSTPQSQAAPMVNNFYQNPNPAPNYPSRFYVDAAPKKLTFSDRVKNLFNRKNDKSA